MSKASKLSQRSLRPVAARGRRARLGRVAVEPALDVVVVELLAPQHPGERLPHHVRLVVRARRRRQLGVELVRLAAPLRGHVGEVRPRRPPSTPPGRSRSAQLHGLARRHRDAVVERRLGAAALGVDRVGAGDDVVVDPVLRVARRPSSPKSRSVFVSLSQNSSVGAAPSGPSSATSSSSPRNGCSVTTRAAAPSAAQLGRLAVEVPGPGVAVPGRRQHVERVVLGAGVRDLDRQKDVEGVGLGVVRLDDPVAVVVEDARVEQLVLRDRACRAPRSPRRAPRTGYSPCG